MSRHTGTEPVHKWYVMAAVAVGIFWATIDASIVNIALPVLEQDLHTDFAIVEWVVLAYMVTIVTLLLALTIGQTRGFSTAPVLALFAGFVVFLGAFLAVEARTRQPMIELRLFTNSLFSINLITGFLAFVSSAGTVLLMPYYLQGMRRYSPFAAGLMLATVPVAVAAVAPRAGALSDRFGTRPLTALGLGILVVGYAAASTLGLGTSALGYVLRFLPVGIGIGCFQSPNNSAIMGAVPRERLGVASGLLSLTRTLGQTVGIAVIGALWSTRVFAYTDDATLPDASAAPASVQVAALNQTLRVTVGLVVIALVLSLWALRQERRMRTAGRTAPHS